MARPIILGNGALTVGLNEFGLVHDFYYPYVGMDNLTTARSAHHKVGIWVDNKFSWVDDGSWDTKLDFDSNVLVSNIELNSSELQISLRFNDFVNSESNIFCRQVEVTNHADRPREIRVFMHQVFQISTDGRADTAIYIPDESYILDYKGRCALLVYGETDEGLVFDQFAIGNYGIEGKEGTYRDAEDGELSGSPVEHGGVDSVIRLTLDISSEQTRSLNYWIVAADSQYSAEKLHCNFKSQGFAANLQVTKDYWHKWLAVGANTLHSVDSQYLDIVKKSLMIIKVHTDKRGGIIASVDSSIYNYGRDYYSYVWPRDGAYAIWPLIRLGYTEEPKRFFEFCRDILNKDGYLMHKYQPDRAIGSTWHPWLQGLNRELPIQEDETAAIVYMLGEYYEYSKDEEFVKSLYPTFIQPAANFMSTFIDEQTGLPHATYDLWEEKFLTSTYTTALTYQSLLVAADLATLFEFPDDATNWKQAAEKIISNSSIFFDTERQAYRKGILLQHDKSLQFDNVLDVSSMYGVMMYGLSENPEHLKSTVSKIEQLLLDVSPSGGSPRYENDNYFQSDPAYMGNPWFVTTLWMAQYYARHGDLDKARHYIDWGISKTTETGTLPEQINPSDSSYRSVSPLVWSHAELVNTILDVMKLG